MKKLISLVLALAMVLMVGAALAADDGSISVTNATKGQTYEAYLIFTASPSDPDVVTDNIIYTATAAQIAVDGFDDVFDTIVDENGDYTISVKEGVTADTVISFVKDNIDDLKRGSAIAGTWDDNDTITFSDLKYGYYYISSSLGTLVTIDTAGKDITVYDKNESTPTGPDKIITAEDSSIDSSLDQSSLEAEDNKTSVGSTESFEVTFSATNWVKSDDEQTAGSGSEGTKVTEWNFADTPTGLAIDASTVKIYVNGDDITSDVTDIAVGTDGKLTFTIPWVDEDGKHLYATETNGSELIPVKVTYDAVVTDDAATEVATNEVEIKYNDDEELGNATTSTYTYKFKVLKTDENGDALEGAEFELYFGDGTGDPLTFTVDSDGVYHYDPNGTETHIAPSGTNAEALVVGLDDTSYTLKEVVVPAGYNKAADATVSGLSRVDAEAVEIEVENNKGTELPSTGGIGTTIFYVIGGILLVGAAIILVARRKASE